jgi:hypothetical protein
MVDVVVAGSNNEFDFAVVDFTNPASPTKVLVTPPFQGGCMVDISGSLAAVGNFNGGEVEVFDVSNPASPVHKGGVSTVLGGIGSISIDGNRVLVGELNGLRAILIDASNPSSPSIVSTHNTGISSITSIAISGTKGVAAGPNDLAFSVINYSNPTTPTHVKFLSNTNGVFFGGPMQADLDGARAALADGGGGEVHFFDVSGANPVRLGLQTTIQAGVFSLSISGTTVAAASTNNVDISLVSFTNPNSPTEGDLSNTQLNGGAVIKLAGNRLAAGDVLGFDVALFSVSGTTLTFLGKINTTLGSIGTIGFSSFTAPAPQAQIAVDFNPLAFGTVLGSGNKTLPIKISNNGNATLNVTNLQIAPSSHYSFTPTGNFNISSGGAPKTLNVKFTPGGVGNFPGTLTMSTNDPAHPSLVVNLTGAGGFPHLVPPGPLDFGDVAVCLSHSLNAVIGNTGPVDMSVSQIAVSGAGFSHGGGSTLTVPANGQSNIVVSFSPTSTGAKTGSLSFHTDDPNAPTATVALSGNGTPEPPPEVSVSPTSIDFQAVPFQYFAGIGVTVANTGPCEDLHVTLTVAGAGFVLTTGNPTTLPPTNPPITATIAANTAQNFTVVFAPTDDSSAFTGTLTVDSDDPNNASVVVPLAGQGVPVSPAAVELVLDRSGSMATAITGGTRMTALQSAVSMFSALVLPDTGFEMGSVEFDNQIHELTLLGPFDVPKQTAISQDAAGLTPRNATCIGGGLQLGQTKLDASAMPRKVAIVFTDGFENTAPLVSSVEQNVLNAGTEVYAVGLGDPAFLQPDVLSDLAFSSGGKFFNTTDPLVLRKQFVEILADAFRLNMAADPIFTLQQGVKLDVPVQITECEARISFVLLWEDPAAQIQFSIRAPDGTTFTASAPNHNRLVRYVQKPGFRFFQIALPPGPNGTIGPKQIGEWTMRIDPVSLPNGPTRASTNVMVQSDLHLSALVTAPSVVDPMRLHVRIMDHKKIVPDAEVRVLLTSPITPLSQIVTPAVRARALLADTHPIPPNLQILTKTHTTKHLAHFNEREYLLALPPPKIDGVYHFEVEATGKACGGIFERYWSTSIYIGRRRKHRPSGAGPGAIGHAGRAARAG